MNRRPIALAAASILFSALASGCETIPAPNRGATTTADPSKRIGREDGPASKDLITATDDMVQQIAALPEFRNSPQRVILVMDQVVNRTSMPARNFDIYLARIRANLNQSGARENIGFVLKNAELAGIQASEGLEPITRTKAEYVLRGVFLDAPNAGTNFYLMTFQIVDLRDGQAIWEGSYEVKFA